MVKNNAFLAKSEAIMKTSIDTKSLKFSSHDGGKSTQKKIKLSFLKHGDASGPSGQSSKMKIMKIK